MCICLCVPLTWICESAICRQDCVVILDVYPGSVACGKQFPAAKQHYMEICLGGPTIFVIDLCKLHCTCLIVSSQFI